MKVLIASDVRILEKTGKYYVEGEVASVIERYAGAFGPLRVYCRCIQTEDVNAKYLDITWCIEKLFPASSLMGALLGVDNNKVAEAIRDCDLVVGRMHSMLGGAAFDCAKRLGKPFFAEVMGDAWDAYWNHGLVGKLVAPYMFLKTKQVVKNADYALYVTSQFLQSRYPCKNESIGASNVRIESVDPQMLEKRLEKIRSLNPGEISLMTTAAVDVRYKGQEYVIRAIPLLNRAGIRVRYTLVGGGSQDYLRRLAEKCGVADQVIFTGRKSLDEVFTLLEQADIYIQPSLQEGLPRSVIEAMSRGCACIGAKTAGIPELLDPRFVVKRKSVSDIVDKIIMYSELPIEERKAVAVRNFEESKRYQAEVLDDRRNRYYKKVVEELTK